MKRVTHRSSYMYVHVLFIKLYVKTACFKAHVLINTVVKNTNQKDALDSLESPTNSQKRKTHFKFVLPVHLARDFT